MLCIGGITHAEVDPGAVIQDAARVGERLEARPASVLAHPRVADAPEWQTGSKRLDRAFVDACGARHRRVEDARGYARVLGEHIDSKSRGPAIHRLDDRLNRGDFRTR